MWGAAGEIDEVATVIQLRVECRLSEVVGLTGPLPALWPDMRR